MCVGVERNAGSWQHEETESVRHPEYLGKSPKLALIFFNLKSTLK